MLHPLSTPSGGGRSSAVTCPSVLRPPLMEVADNIFICIFLNETFWILIKISLKLVRKGPIANNSALVQIMAWRRIGDKPLSETMLTQFIDTYICGIRGRWVYAELLFRKHKYAFILHYQPWNKCWNLLSRKTEASPSYNQYHGCWWPGDVRSQGISSQLVLS